MIYGPQLLDGLGKEGKAAVYPSVEKILCKLVAGSDLMADGNRKLVNPGSQALP